MLTVIGVGLCLTAANWQLGRADEKQALFARFDAGADTGLNRLIDDEALGDFRFQTLRVAGRYDPDRQILLENMVHAGRNGYHVLTPLQTGDGTVLVNRGWIPASPDRRKLPDIRVPDGERNIAGRLDRLPVPGVRLAAAPIDDEAPWPRRLLFPTRDEVSQHLGYPVKDYQIRLDAEDDDGYLREWRPQVMGADKHFGYAVQWFAFSAAITALYLVLNIKRRKSV